MPSLDGFENSSAAMKEIDTTQPITIGLSPKVQENKRFDRIESKIKENVSEIDRA